LFYNCLASPKRHICAHALTWPYPSDSYKAILVVQTTTTYTGHTLLSLFPSLSLLLIVASLNICLVYSTLGVLLHNCC
ncbi:unnamed protein product, partial [Hymenolepis diminuta]